MSMSIEAKRSWVAHEERKIAEYLEQVRALPDTGWVIGWSETNLYLHFDEQRKPHVGGLVWATKYPYQQPMSHIQNGRGEVVQTIALADAKAATIADQLSLITFLKEQLAAMEQAAV